MAICHLDVSEYPIVLSVLEGKVDEENANRLIAEMLALRSKNERYVAVNDISHFELPDLKVRNLLMNYAESSGAHCDRYVAGMATVVSNPLMKSLMLMVNAFTRTAYPVKVFRARQEALAWARSIIDKEGLNFPAPMGR